MSDWHELSVRVRYAETDGMGYLHHANHAVYFEMGRTELFREAGGDYAAMERDGLFLVVVKLECRYVAPARYDDVLTIRTRITRATAAKLEHEYELLRGETVLARANSMLACVDREGVVRRMPELPGAPVE